MSNKFVDIIYGIVIRFKWRYIFLLFLVFFAGSWWATDYFEPGDITSSSVYWWYFLSNVIHGNYSGYSPVTLGGRILSIVTFLGGGIFFIATICKITTAGYEHLQQKSKGLAKLKMKNHIVLLGYRAGETESLLRELRAEHFSQTRIVLCSKHLEENPFPGVVDFIRGDTSSDDTLNRACVATAAVIVISGHTDERTLPVAVAVTSVAQEEAHIVVYLEKADNARFLKMLKRPIECVTSLRTSLIAQAVFNPGSTELLRNLVSLDHTGTNFKLLVPEHIPEVYFSLMLNILHRDYNAIVIGYSENHSPCSKSYLNPAPNTRIRGGMALFYIAESRIDKLIDWSVFTEAICEIPQIDICPTSV